MKARRWIQDFIGQETTGGIVMLMAAAAALILANSPFYSYYTDFVHLPMPGGIDAHFAISDILMPVFFLFVGLELKHEMLQGALATNSQRILPLIAALGGIAAPALIYLAVTQGHPGLQDGWAIPTATDIAFAICVVSLVGQRVPVAAKVFLLAIAIYDDLAAILIIAVFYSGDLAMMPLAMAGTVTGVMVLLSRYSSARPLPFLLLGAWLGFLLHQAGIHTTVAGMVTGLCIGRPFVKSAAHQMHPYVAFLILPLFAFASAGVRFSGMSAADIIEPLPLGIALGLLLGKPLGIVAATLGAVALGFATLPERTNWRTVGGIAIIAGIGFTMSLFIGQLAFHDPLLQNEMKLGVMGGSLLSACIGWALLRHSVRQ